MYSLVEEEVTKEEYIVEEEYGDEMRPAAERLPAESIVVEAVPPTLSQLADKRVDDALPYNWMREVVADTPAAG